MLFFSESMKEVHVVYLSAAFETVICRTASAYISVFDMICSEVGESRSCFLILGFSVGIFKNY